MQTVWPQSLCPAAGSFHFGQPHLTGGDDEAQKGGSSSMKPCNKSGIWTWFPLPPGGCSFSQERAEVTRFLVGTG